VSAAWLIGVAGFDVSNVFKPSSCKLSFDRRRSGRWALCEYDWEIHDATHTPSRIGVARRFG